MALFHDKYVKDEGEDIYKSIRIPQTRHQTPTMECILGISDTSHSDFVLYFDSNDNEKFVTALFYNK